MDGDDMQPSKWCLGLGVLSTEGVQEDATHVVGPRGGWVAPVPPRPSPLGTFHRFHALFHTCFQRGPRNETMG